MRTESRGAGARSAHWPVPLLDRRYRCPGRRRCDRKSTVGSIPGLAPARQLSCRQVRPRGQAGRKYSWDSSILVREGTETLGECRRRSSRSPEGIPVKRAKCRNRRSPGKRRDGLRKLNRTPVSLSREATDTDARFPQKGDSRLTEAWSRSHAVARDGAQVVATG